MKRDCVTDTPMAELQRSVLQIWHSIKFRVEIAVALQGPSTMSASSTFGVEHWRITTLSPFSVRKKKKRNQVQKIYLRIKKFYFLLSFILLRIIVFSHCTRNVDICAIKIRQCRHLCMSIDQFYDVIES